MIQKLTLTSVKKYTNDKDGNPLKTKQGKPYTRVNIKTSEHGDNWLSGFGAQYNDSWQEGDEVTVEVEKKEVNGKTYINFSKVDELAATLPRIAKLEEQVMELHKRLKALEPKTPTKVAGTDIDYPENDLDVPF